MAATSVTVHITPLTDAEDAEAFQRINAAWISELFSLTDEDRRVLDDPVGQIIAPGGAVLIARTDDDARVGCIALLSYPGDVFELSKMGVTPEAQGHGIGNALIRAAVEHAAARGGRRLFLGTNSRLQPAIHLYERAGFRRITKDDLPVDDYYARADILMGMDLTTVNTDALPSSGR